MVHSIFSSPLVGEDGGGGDKQVVPTPHPTPSPTRGEGTQNTFWQRLTWTSADGVQLVGLYHPAQRSGAMTWVLLHGLGSNKGEWDAFAKALAGRGSGVFIYDARGHHESNRSAAGAVLNYQSWTYAGPGSPWDAMTADLGSAVQWLGKNYQIPESRIAVGGASLGANIALVYASKHPEVPAVILLSPGLEYAGIQTEPAFKVYRGRPVLIAASPADAYAYASVRQLTRRNPSAACKVVNGKKGHGVAMLDAEFTKTLLDWIASWK